MSDATQLVDEIKSTLATIQSKNNDLEARGQKNSDGMEELKAEFDKALEQLESINGKLTSEEEARKSLELAMSRMSEKSEEKDLLGSSEYKSAFHEFVASGGRSGIAADAISKEIEKTAGGNKRLETELKMHFTGSNPDGGYLVPADLRTNILTRIREITPFRTVADVTTTNRDRVEWPVSDDHTQRALWADELDTRLNTGTARIGVIEIPVNELYSNPFITNSNLEDSGINMESFIREYVAQDFAKAESVAFTTGDGVKKPMGFLSYPVTAIETYKRGSVMQRETAANDALAADDLIKLQGNIKEGYQGNAAWMMNRQFFSGAVATLKDTYNQYLLDPRMLFNGVQPILLGKGVVFNPDMATVVADAARPVAYGDWRQFYKIVDRIMMVVLRDPYTDERGVKFKFRKRVGGGVTNFEAVKVLKIQ